MDEKNYIDLPESIDQNIPQTYKFDSALTSISNTIS